MSFLPMKRPWLDEDVARGTLHRLVHRSDVLAGNAFHDPVEREVWVYTPHGFDDGGGLPAVMMLAGFTGTGRNMLNTGLRSPSLDMRVDALIAAGAPPCVLVFPDCMTSIGGSQYVNSTSTGRYADYVAQELVPFVSQHFRLSGAWGVAGKSSGGFGALSLVMDFPGRFQAAACHSGDAHFESCYIPDFAPAAVGIERAGGVDAWWHRFCTGGPLIGADHTVLNVLAMACCYSPAEGANRLNAALPMDLYSGALDAEVFERWSAYDPVVRCRERPEGLKGLELLWLECGTRDSFRLYVGARTLHRALLEGEISHHFEEFDGDHFKLDYRYNHSLPAVFQALHEA